VLVTALDSGLAL